MRSQQHSSRLKDYFYQTISTRVRQLRRTEFAWQIKKRPMPPKFSRSLDSCNRSYCRRSLSNLRGDSSPALAHEARGDPDGKSEPQKQKDCITPQVDVKKTTRGSDIDQQHQQQKFNNYCALKGLFLSDNIDNN